MQTTPVLALPYPQDTDTADIGYWLQQLALSTEADIYNTAWTSYTPTVTGTTAPTVVGRYCQSRGIIAWSVDITLTAAVTGGITVTLPVSARAIPNGVARPLGVAEARNVGAGWYMQGVAHTLGTGAAVTTATVMLPASSTSSLLAGTTATVPWTWASGHTISISGTYEMA